ncbi:hypothetical protein AMELA_G00258260, partial [Ameiurus melas]
SIAHDSNVVGQLWCVLLGVSSLCPSSCLSYSTSLQSLLYLLLTLLVSSLSTRVPSHTDTMLPALCSLFTALSCVSGVTVVTQKPPVLTLTRGQTATMDCNLGTVTDSVAGWYKQVPGGAPQYVLRNYHDWSAPSYGSGFSSSKFTSTHSSKSDYKLIISNVEVGDSAVYYCQTYDSSVKGITVIYTMTKTSSLLTLTSAFTQHEKQQKPELHITGTEVETHLMFTEDTLNPTQ